MSTKKTMREDPRVEVLEKKVEAALGLLDQEGADALIGEAGEEHGVLIQGTEAAVTMAWALLKGQGVEQTQKRLKVVAQLMTILLAIVHYAYALGVKKGRGEAHNSEIEF